MVVCGRCSPFDQLTACSKYSALDQRCYVWSEQCVSLTLAACGRCSMQLSSPRAVDAVCMLTFVRAVDAVCWIS